ncbi:MAG: phage major capsid protein [Rhodomicrobium sp.]
MPQARTTEEIIAESRALRERLARDTIARIEAKHQARGMGTSAGGQLEARAMAAVRQIERTAEQGRRMASIRASRPNFLTGSPETGRGSPEARERRRAFAHYARTGQVHASLQTSSDAGGGVFVPIEISQTIRENLVQVSQVRKVAHIEATSTDTLRIPRRTGASTASWVAEIDAANATGPAYGAVDIPVDDSRCYVDVSNNFLADSAIDIEAWLVREFAREMARLEGAAFINGTGAKQPLGLQTATGINYYPSGNASTLVDDAVVALPFQLPAMYAQNGVWLMNRQTMGAVRQFKDTVGRYIFDATLDKNGLPTIMGQPVIDCPDMPNIGPNTFPIIYGDMDAAYIIVDRAGPMTLLRDIYTQANVNQTRFYAFRRVGGAPVLGEAIIKLKVATS